MKTFFYVIAFLVGIFILSYLSLSHYKFFSPKFQDAKRQVFENTQSYVEGKRQEATKLYYESKTNDNKDLICQVVRMNFANFDVSLLQDSTLKSFINSCK